MTALSALAVRALVGLLPVLSFLALLMALDSYKLVRLRMVLAVIALGGAAAVASYLAGFGLIQGAGIDFRTYSHYIGPGIEEGFKALSVIALMRSNRIGFLVDAAIFGFAVGAGFALVENVYYLNALVDSRLAVWVMRGFGTALMHGGVQAVFAVALLALSERRTRMDAVALLPPFVLAASVHLAFNQFALSPALETALVLVLLPTLFYFVYWRSERSVEGWLSTGFDADTELIELINSGQFSESPVGRYLHELRARFRGMAVADMLCYLRLHVELALRAKGMLMQREFGFEIEIDEPTREKFEEMRYLEKSMGPTALLALKPFLRTGRKDLWQLYLLQR